MIRVKVDNVSEGRPSENRNIISGPGSVISPETLAQLPQTIITRAQQLLDLPSNAIAPCNCPECGCSSHTVCLIADHTCCADSPVLGGGCIPLPNLGEVDPHESWGCELCNGTYPPPRETRLGETGINRLIRRLEDGWRRP